MTVPVITEPSLNCSILLLSNSSMTVLMMCIIVILANQWNAQNRSVWLRASSHRWVEVYDLK